MADKKITELSELTSVNVDTDYIPIVDASEPDVDLRTKKILPTNLQVQSDWTEVDTGSPAYIKNKSGDAQFEKSLTQLNPIDSAVESIVLGPTKLPGATSLEIDLNKGLKLNSIASPAHEDGLIFNDNVNHCITSYNDRSGVSLQNGRELWTVRPKNNTGVLIPNGTVVYVSGWDTDQPTVMIASNNIKLEAEGVIGLTTEALAIGGEGEVTRIGKVADIDTQGETSAAPFYLGLNGQWTTTRPLPPNYVVRLGVIGEVGALGSLLVDANPFDGTDTGVNMVGALNGVCTQLQMVDFRVDTGVIYADVTNEEIPTDKLPFIIDDDRYLLDTITGAGVGGAARVALTPGTINNPQVNFIYIELVGGVPTLKSSTTFPFTDFAWIGIVSVKDVATTNSDNVYSWQRFNNQVDNGGGDGIFNYILDRIRREGARYASGIDPTITINAGVDPDSVKVSTTSGFISQAHNQDYDSQDGNTYYVINHPTEPFKKISDINEIDVYSDGSLISNNDRLGLNIFANQNSNGVPDKLFINLPRGGYSSDVNAVDDISNQAITTMPAGSNTVNNTVRLYRLVLKYSTTSGGTWTNLLGANGFQDERGQLLGLGGGGGGSTGKTTFSDGQFNIYNNADPSKVLTFDLTGITTATSRALTAPDASGIIALISDLLYSNLPDRPLVFTDTSNRGYHIDNRRLYIGYNVPTGALEWNTNVFGFIQERISFPEISIGTSPYYLAFNTIFDASENWIYADSFGSPYRITPNQLTEDIIFESAPIGTQGNTITWSEKFRIGKDAATSAGSMIIGKRSTGTNVSGQMDYDATNGYRLWGANTNLQVSDIAGTSYAKINPGSFQAFSNSIPSAQLSSNYLYSQNVVDADATDFDVKSNNIVHSGTGDVYSEPLTDYSATSTFTGWTSFTQKVLQYKRIGKTVTVYFVVDGTSNTASASFSLPYTAVTITNLSFTTPYRSFDGTTNRISYLDVFSGSNTVNLYMDPSNTPWPTTGRKFVSGQLSYEIA